METIVPGGNASHNGLPMQATRFVHDAQGAVGESPLFFSSRASPRLLPELHRMRSRPVDLSARFPVREVQDRIPEVYRLSCRRI